MKVTNIKYLSGSKYQLIIDNKKHVIFDDVLLAFNLYKPCEISKDVYDELISKNSFYDGYNKALNFINYKMRSEKEVYQKLISLDISKNEIGKIIGKLREEGYIDNKKYAHFFILDQINLTLNGPKKIVIELKKKGISDNIIAEEISSIDDSVFKNNAKKYINKKIKVIKSGSLERIKLKLKNDLYNLGYLEKYFEEYFDTIEIDENDNYAKDKLKLEKRLSKKYEGEKLEYMVKQKLYAMGYRQ